MVVKDSFWACLATWGRSPVLRANTISGRSLAIYEKYFLSGIQVPLSHYEKILPFYILAEQSADLIASSTIYGEMPSLKFSSYLATLS